MNLFKKFSLAIAASFFVAPMAMADVAITYSSPIKPEETMVLNIIGNKVGMQIPGPQGQQGRMIYDGDADKIFMVMDDQRQYMDMDEMMASLGGMSDMLSGMMENLPDDAKDQLGGILGGLLGKEEPAEAPPAPELVETGESDSINGIQCDIATITSLGQTTELCLADPDDVGINDADFATMRAMMLKQQATAEKAGEMIGDGSLNMNMGDLNRIPLRMRDLGANGEYSEFKGTSAEVDPTSITIPEDYTPAKMGL